MQEKPAIGLVERGLLRMFIPQDKSDPPDVSLFEGAISTCFPRLTAEETKVEGGEVIWVFRLNFGPRCLVKRT